LRFDYIGFSLLTVGVSALQIFLDKGQEDDWFGSNFISTLVVTSLVCLTGLVIWEWRQKQPIVDVKLFKLINFASANVMMFMAGAVVFSATVLMPQFLQTLMGYTAQQAGLVVSAGAGMMMITMPLVGILTGKVPAKYLIIVGWIISAAGLLFTTRLLSLDISFGTAAVIMMMQFGPLGLVFVPAITVAYFGVPKDRSDSVSGLTNFTRNIGSSVGVSLVQTIMARRMQFHLTRLGDHLSPGAPGMAMSIQAMASQARGVSAQGAQATGFALIYESLMRQAVALSYLDLYVVLGAGAGAMFFLSLLLKSNDPKSAGQHVGH
jgi:DHA2 family multidrug resistance protein